MQCVVVYAEGVRVNDARCAQLSTCVLLLFACVCHIIMS